MNKGGVKPSEELKHFTNREDEKKVFTKYVNAPDGSSLPVLMFYGVGGIGKTWLTKRLRQLLSEPPFVNKPGDMPLPSVRLNMDVNRGGGRYHDDAANVYATLRRQFDIECPAFDLAYAMLRHKQGVRDEAEFRYGGTFHNAWELIGEAGSAAASSIPGGNLLVWLGKKASKWAGRELQDTALGKYLLSAAGNREFFELRAMEEDELYRILPQRLGADLDAKLPERIGHVCRGVIVVDTLEAVLESIENEAQQYERIRWIVSLYEHTNHILLVMAGRDRLTWEKVDSDWSDPGCLDQHLVGGLSRHDATTFLGWCGVTDARLQNAILRVCVDVKMQGTPHGDTPYHPYSLGLCADTIVKESSRGVASDPDTFDMAPGDYDQLAQRFLKSLANDAEADWIARMALPFRFDEAAARHAFSPVSNSAQNVAWKNLKDYSFVTAPDPEGWRTLHPRMSEALRKRLADPTKPGDAQRSHTEWRAYWQSRTQSDTDDFAQLAWFHQWYLEPDEAREEWKRLIIRARSGRRPNMGLHYSLLRWWLPTNVEMGMTWKTAAASNSIAEEFAAASLGSRNQNLQQAIACYEAALRVYTEADFPQDWAMTQNNLGKAYSDLPTGDRRANLHHAIACHQAAQRVYTETDNPHKWGIAMHNLGKDYNDLPNGDKKADLQCAIDYYTAALRVRTKADFPQEWAMTTHNLGNVYRNLPTGTLETNLLQAIACFEAALHIYMELGFSKDSAMCQNSLGNAYLELHNEQWETNLQRAIDCFTAALHIRTEADFPYEWAGTQHNLGNAYAQLSTGDPKTNLQRAIGYYTVALRVRTEADLPEKWADTQYNIAEVYVKLGNKAEARQAMRYAVRGYRAVGMEDDAKEAEAYLQREDWP